MKIDNQLIEKHGLTLDEYNTIKKLINREPNLLELGIFSYRMNIVHTNLQEYILKATH